MVSELISLPLRISARAARLSLYTAEEALRLTAGLAEQVIQTVRPTPQPDDAPDDAPHAVPQTKPAREPSPMTPDHVDAQVAEPVHVSSEPTLVEERADPGAENGAGAEVHVDEPWPEYERMGAPDIVARLQQAAPAELAAVELYERNHRARQTVLTAAEDRLRAGGGRESQT